MMDAGSRQQARQRAGSRCEYCCLRQEHEPFHPFHIEHIIAKQHGGTDDMSNLALACIVCNSHKGPNLFGIDPDSGEPSRLFHPRKDEWTLHFKMEGPLIIGLTPIGRTTAWLLKMNRRERVVLRQTLLELGELD